LKANPNATNSDGQTPLHIAVQRYLQLNTDRKARLAQRQSAEIEVDHDEDLAQEEEEQFLYEDLKRIMKELLFNGAKREIKAKFELNDPD
jgi:Ankyrin repeat